MQGNAAEVAGDSWSSLLTETRRALAYLRADELEELAARAECRLRATMGENWIRQQIPAPEAGDLRGLTRQHRLLGGLLLATDENRAVLRRLQERESDAARNGRWVR